MRRIGMQGRFIMGNKLARTVVFFYTIILHVLVFLVSSHNLLTSALTFLPTTPVFHCNTNACKAAGVTHFKVLQEFS